MRNKLLLIWLVSLLPACALGRIDDAIDQFESTLDDLHTGPCIRECTKVGKVCFESASTMCVDECEVEDNKCDEDETACWIAEQYLCSQGSDNLYPSCIAAAQEKCDFGCNQADSDCKQVCGEEAANCLSDNIECIAVCVDELENSLKEIDI